MTDKQIIIDGVDVSKCTRYCADNGKCTAFKSQYLCSERDNCYTKRILKKNKTINILKEKLLRKEQECEKYKQTLIRIKEIAEEAKKDICNNCGWRNTDGCNPEDYTCGEFIKILQKTSECEVENE